MRAVTVEEIEQISGGLKKVYAKNGMRPEDTWAPCNPTCPPTTVGPPSSGGGGGGWSSIPTGGTGGGPSHSAPSIGSGGGGGSPWYNDGTHDVFDRTYTSKIAGRNNPGDLMYGSASYDKEYGMTGKASNGTATFATEQDGRNALGEWLDNNAGTDTVANFETKSGFNDTPSAPTGTAHIESYMAKHGYANASGDNIHNMSSAEFNIFLDGITYAEGVTNM